MILHASFIVFCRPYTLTA